MTRNPRACRPSDTLLDALRLMQELNIGFIPVVEINGVRKLVGVLTDRDIAMELTKDARPSEVSLASVMKRDLIWCEPDADIFRCAELMEKYQVRRLPVLNDKRDLIGVLTTADLIRLAERRKDVESELAPLLSAIVSPCASFAPPHN